MKTLLTLSLLTLTFCSFSQMTELEVRQMVNKADEQQLVFESSRMLQENYYYHAEIVVDKLLSMKPQSPNYNYKKGFIVLDSRSDFETAMRHLEIAITNTNKNYDAYSAKEESAPVDAYFHLARCYHLDEQLDKATEYFNLFIANSSKKSERVKQAELMLKQVAVAKELIAHPKSAEVRNIGAVVNGPTPEYAPVVSLDGTSLYFTSRREWEDKSSDQFKDPMLNNYPEDIYVSYADFEGEWTSPEKLAFCNNQMNEATIAVSSDEKRIFVYQDITGGGDIYYSDFSGNQFDVLNELNYTEVNTKYWETHCTVTPDGQTMYFVSDRPGGYGGRDIYRIVKLPNGEWSKAQNMGPEINTPNDEDSPFIDVNNKTLYYASNGAKSMGDFDIFVTFRDADNNWSEPLNLGYPINSTGADVFYTTTIDGLKGYLSSFRKGGFGEKDIYEIKNDYLGNRPISALRGAFVSLNNDPVSDDMKVVLKCLNCQSEEAKSTDLRVKNGTFFAVLERCKDYKIEYYDASGKVIGTDNYTTLCNAENEEIDATYYLGDYNLALSTTDSKTKANLQGTKIDLVDPTSREIIRSYTTNANGTVTQNYISDKKFGDQVNVEIVATKDNYQKQTFILDTVLGKNGIIKVDLALVPKGITIDIGGDLSSVIDINPIYFDLDKSDIRPDAAIELDKIVKIMNENPTMRIELASHTDCRASKAYNQSLSDRRAKSSAAYIRQRITNPSRIYGKGYGESKLKNDCGCEGEVVSTCSEAEHQANRRTEFTILQR